MTSCIMNFLNAFFSMFSPSGSGVRRIEPGAAAQLVRENKALLVDVREPAEWSGGVAENAALLPLSDLTGTRRRWKPFLDRVDDREIILYCRSGARSGAVARILAAEGFQAANAGSLHAWHRAGLPVRPPHGAR
jgi:rhodanese-related sulfurtransferase